MISEEEGAIFLTSSNSSIISYARSRKGTIIVRVCGHIKVFGIALIFLNASKFFEYHQI